MPDHAPFDPAKLRELRKRAGLTQAALARLVHVHETHVVHWESGRRAPRPQMRSTLASILQIDPSELLADSGHDPLATPMARLRMDKGVSQAAVASAVGMPRPTYARIETGARGTLRMDLAERIAGVLAVDTDTVLAAHTRAVEQFQARR